ncbi:MAG: hypothetical protein O3A01_05395 [bacterium]|nr:hypothetical protein [bacterium]
MSDTYRLYASSRRVGQGPAFLPNSWDQGRVPRVVTDTKPQHFSLNNAHFPSLGEGAGAGRSVQTTGAVAVPLLQSDAQMPMASGAASSACHVQQRSGATVASASWHAAPVELDYTSPKTYTWGCNPDAYIGRLHNLYSQQTDGSTVFFR